MGMTIFNSQGLWLGFSFWKHSSQYVGNGGIYSVGKDLVEHKWQNNKKNVSQVFHRKALPMNFSRDLQLSWLFAFQLCALHVTTLQDSFSRTSCEIHLIFNMRLSLHTLSHTTLTIKSHIKCKIKWSNRITIKFGMKLKPTQNGCK